MFLKKKQPLIFALRRHKHLKSLTCSQGQTTKPITLSLNINTARITAQLRKQIAHVLVSFTTVIRENYIFLLTPRCYTSCRFLPEIEIRSDILETVTLGPSVKHFGISLQNWGPNETSTSWRNNSTWEKQDWNEQK